MPALTLHDRRHMIFDLDAPARRGISPSDHQRATEQARIAQMTDEEVDAALALARDLRYLAATNRVRARHGLSPLTDEDFVAAHTRRRLDQVATVMNKARTY